MSETKRIPLSQGQYAIVDAADYEWLNKMNWHAYWNRTSKSFYATSSTPKARKTIWMHRLILDCLPSELCDHKNHDTLDNRRENLRKCTNAQNQYNQRRRKDNTTGFKGVGRSGTHTFKARIKINGRTKYIGTFASAELAAEAYKKATKEVQGDFAYEL